MKFTLGAGLVVASVLLLLGAAVNALALLIGELPESPWSLAIVGAYLVVAALSFYAGFRVLRSGTAPQPARRP